MSIGMSADEYWHGPPQLIRVYKEAYKLRVRHENEYAWLQGMYVHQGVAVALSNGFGKKGGKKVKYPEKPADLGLETEWEKQDKARKERDKIIANLSLWKHQWDRARGKKSGEKS